MSFNLPRDDRKEKNQPPPPSSFRSTQREVESRKIRNITTAADYAELQRAYTFIPKETKTSSSSTTWQERMVNHYHSKLYKEYVLADFRRPPQVGMRWRTRSEVEQGKGHKTCGNKHCPSYQQPDTKQDYAVRENNQKLLRDYYQHPPPSSEARERCLLERLPNGVGLQDYEVNFAYEEGGQQKNELVKLRLCLRCAPLLFQTKGADRCLQARFARDKMGDPDREESNDTRAEQSSLEEESVSSSGSEREHRKRQRRRKEKKRRTNRNDRKRSTSQSESEYDSDGAKSRHRRSRKREKKHHKKKKIHKKSSR